jgi:hypothetical protein
MSSQIIGMWTAFETLAGDLWESALNAHPKGLASLKGTKDRITDKAYRRHQKTERNENSTVVEEVPTIPRQGMAIKLNDLQVLTHGTYNLSAKMGQLLRHYFKFTTLTGIREAYSCAFMDHTDFIDTALISQALDTLSLVRNLLVHKAGIADQIYLDDAKSVPGAPRPSLGQALEIDGTMVNELVSPVFTCGTKLITSVDSYLSREGN